MPFAPTEGEYHSPLQMVVEKSICVSPVKLKKVMALVKRVYDINLNYLGVRREERRRNSSRRREFFVRALIRTRYHTSFHQRQVIKKK
ncbi:hypothetical protein [Okeania sp. KiyG1]|uniref:hypothetical protein n=1 Tax=Okeania sp. KiyG1 TaxID=2720165 RepID=UPI0019222001|nr:hypothetical protein [Okeania sp. KiyG1]